MRKAEGAARCRALFADGLLERRDLGHGAVCRADRAADAGGVVRIDGEARVAQGVHAAEDLHLAETVELAVEAELHIARAEILRRQLALNARRLKTNAIAEYSEMAFVFSVKPAFLRQVCQWSEHGQMSGLLD